MTCSHESTRLISADKIVTGELQVVVACRQCGHTWTTLRDRDDDDD